MLALRPSSESPPTSMASASKPSGRKGSRKVRTGCITCKIRKVKCDEAKPHCNRCIKTGRKCDGYKQAESPGSGPRKTSMSPLPGLESAEESRAFDYYRNHSAGVLAGTVDVGFWSSVVIKLSATEPAVRHAMLAVSSLHECVETKSKTGRGLDKTFAFQEYGKAISALRSRAQRSHDDDPLVVPLLVCVLFVCIEFLADREPATQMHICQGRKILSGLRDTRSPSMEIVKQSLVPIYARLSLASFMYGSRPEAIPEHLKVSPSVHAIFASLDEARCLLYQICDAGLQFSTRAGAAVYDAQTDSLQMENLYLEQQHLLGQLSRWNAAFTVFLSTNSPSSATSNAQHLLRLYHQCSLVWISTALQPYELAYDAHMPAFTSMISSASSIINSPPQHSSETAAFSFETELVAPIYWLATKCRHPILRRAALKILSQDQVRNRRENLWYTPCALMVAARVIEIEETGIEELDDQPFDPSNPVLGLNEHLKREGGRPSFVRQHGLPTDALQTSLTEPPTPSPGPPALNDISRSSSSDTMSSHRSSSRDISQEPVSLASLTAEGIPDLSLSGSNESTLETPFGIDESLRVKNATIERVKDGAWATFFRDPSPGETDWGITREFLRF